jgi:methionyl-tRNA synthetase
MTVYFTTPIYYVNSTPHIGHAYTTIAADILVRHHRQRGEDAFFLTGVDEHATKVWRVAEEQGLDAQAYADRIVTAWRELPRRLNAELDFFIRTSDEGHKTFVRDFLQRIYDNGDVYEDVYAGLYCVGCEAFKTGTSSWTANARCTTASPSGSRRRTTSSGSLRTGTVSWSSTARGRSSCCRNSGSTRR